MAPAHTTATLVGRDAELRQLVELLAESARGQLRVAAIAGPAGLGKTRLAQTLAESAEAQGWRTLRAHCDESLGAEAMQPFVQLARALDAPSAASAAQAAASLGSLLASLAAQQPVLLFIDDWHWADDASQQVLMALRRLPPLRLLILLTTRHAPGPHELQRFDRTLALAPLAEAAADALAGALLGPVDPFVRAQVCRHAGGNPLFLGELCHSVTRALLRDASSWCERGGERPNWFTDEELWSAMKERFEDYRRQMARVLAHAARERCEAQPAGADESRPVACP